ncbi:hypothetical protein ACFSQT_34760 [Mesorhizobium calcicola]|uniref:Uncharacterized protein n=1 Tax=Mesorhizobium calcicola TaxID=1300310 RepID=A0ABW4WNS7_9HYPH
MHIDGPIGIGNRRFGGIIDIAGGHSTHGERKSTVRVVLNVRVLSIFKLCGV